MDCAYLDQSYFHLYTQSHPLLLKDISRGILSFFPCTIESFLSTFPFPFVDTIISLPKIDTLPIRISHTTSSSSYHFIALLPFSENFSKELCILAVSNSSLPSLSWTHSKSYFYPQSALINHSQFSSYLNYHKSLPSLITPFSEKQFLHLVLGLTHSYLSPYIHGHFFKIFFAISCKWSQLLSNGMS